MTFIRYEGISSALGQVPVSIHGFTHRDGRGGWQQTWHPSGTQMLQFRMLPKTGMLIPHFAKNDYLTSSTKTRFFYCNDPFRIKQKRAPAMQGRQLEFTVVLKGSAVEVESQSAVEGEGLSTIKPPYVKICGITNVKDAILAMEAGARFVGMILWPRSKRSVSLDTAKQISHAARLHKAEPVGVFVDEDAETIERFCIEADIGIAQLHGDGARASLANLPSNLATIYVLHVDKRGIVQTPMPKVNSVDWILLDSLQGGSGHTFDWEKLRNLSLKSKRGWLLAGGLKPENVATAISILKPDFVDVSSGVTMSDGLLKDPSHVLAFMDAVKSSRNRC